MPTIHQDGPFRFFFYANDRKEPRHVHIERDEKRAKFWLNPVRVAENVGFGKAELNRLLEIVVSNEAAFTREWDAFFGS
jgi:hypothetical protein